MSCSFLLQAKLDERPCTPNNEAVEEHPRVVVHVNVLRVNLDEKVAALHLGRLGVKLTTLSDDQATYLGISNQGPYKPEHYRY